METYTIPVRFTFDGALRVPAPSREEAVASLGNTCLFAGTLVANAAKSADMPRYADVEIDPSPVDEGRETIACGGCGVVLRHEDSYAPEDVALCASCDSEVTGRAHKHPFDDDLPGVNLVRLYELAFAAYKDTSACRNNQANRDFAAYCSPGAVLGLLRVIKGLDKDLADRLDRELREHQASEGALYDADPDCWHRVVSANGGGVRCERCSGWFCL